jgi:two-component system, cell cycle sensor histidine kinase and response regulator CckA
MTQRDNDPPPGAVQSRARLDTFVGGFAHDFNNLLTGMLGHASMARQQAAADSALHDHLQRLETLCQRAAELCRQMLAYAGQMPLALGPVDVNRLIEEAQPALRGGLPRHVTLELYLRPTLPAVQADSIALGHAIENVVTNAADAIGDLHGKVIVTTGTATLDALYLEAHADGRHLGAGEYLFVEIRDTGCGMTDEVRRRMFEPFFSTKSAGRGLGLAAVHGTVHGHGGLITVRSALGQGTTVRLMLPTKWPMTADE